MIKLIPNDILAIQIYTLVNAIDEKISFSKEYLLHDNIFFILAEPFSLGFDLINTKVSKCKPRSALKMNFNDAYKLEFQRLPSALINMIGNAFNQWLGISRYDSQGVYKSLNTEGNRQLNPYSINMEISNTSLIVTHNGEKITYESAVRHLLTKNNVNEPPNSFKNDDTAIMKPKKEGTFAQAKNTFMDGVNEGFAKTAPKNIDKAELDALKGKGLLEYFKASFLSGFYGDEYKNKKSK